MHKRTAISSSDRDRTAEPRAETEPSPAGADVPRLAVVAHPALPLSAFDQRLVAAVSARPNVTTRNLYKAYQDAPFDEEAEREAVHHADEVVLLTLLHGRVLPRLASAWLQSIAQSEKGARTGATFQLLGLGALERPATPSTALQRLETDPPLHRIHKLVRRSGLQWREPVLLHGAKATAEAADASIRQVLDRLGLQHAE